MGCRRHTRMEVSYDAFPLCWSLLQVRLLGMTLDKHPFLTQLLPHAVLIVKIPKTEEYKALQPKKIEVQ